MTGVPTAGPVAGGLPLEDRDRQALLAQRHRRGQPRVAGADHGNIDIHII